MGDGDRVSRVLCPAYDEVDDRLVHQAIDTGIPDLDAFAMAFARASMAAE